MSFRIGTRVRSWFILTICALSSACGGSSPPNEDASFAVDTSTAIDSSAARDSSVGGADANDASPGDTGASRGYRTGVATGTLRGVPETSGIVASRTYPGVFWIHNDSGNAPEVFAIDESAAVLSTIRIEGASNQDWEDIALGRGADGSDVVYLGDIGDNEARMTMGASSSRGGVMRIYRVVEPNPRGGVLRVAADSFDFRYPERPYDCEAMFVDPRTGDLYFVTKDETADVFVAHAPFVAGSTTPLEHVASFPLLTVTAADMSADGTRVVVRSYGDIQVFDVGPSEPRFLSAFRAPRYTPNYTSFAEAICFGADDYDLFTISEGSAARLFRIPWE